jgi:hypothetical protein
VTGVYYDNETFNLLLLKGQGVDFKVVVAIEIMTTTSKKVVMRDEEMNDR